MDGIELKIKANIKFLGVLIDKNLTWKDHISSIKNKISKNIGLIFRAKNVVNKDSLTIKLAIHLICSENKLTHTIPTGTE